MKHPPLRFLWGALLLLLCSFQLNALTITGLSPVCKNSTVPYSVSAPVAGVTYKWSMTNPQGSFSSIYGSSTSVYWSLPGNTVLKVVAFDSSGTRIDSNTKAVTVKPLPQPLITTSYKVACQNFPDDSTKEHQSPKDRQLFMNDGPCVKVCEDSWVTYTATGEPGSTFAWTISGGTPTTAIGNTVTVHWGAIGMGSISVTETTVDGCTGDRTGCIEIIGKPHALFGAMPDVDKSIANGYIVVCLKQDVIFVDRSFATTSSPIVNWLWDFGDGQSYSTSTTNNPIHHYDNPGTYEVTLVVKNACNCTDTFRLKVEVMPEEGVHITCASVVCEAKKDDDKQSYTVGDADLHCSDYNWSVTGGTIISPMPYGPTVDIVWNNVDDDGFGYVHFDASGCDVKCPGITTIKIPVIKNKGVIKGPVALCPQSQYKYTLPAWPGTVYNWTLSNGSMGYLSHTDQPNEIVVHTYNGGAAQLICEYTNSLAGCGGKAVLDIAIMPSDDIVGNDLLCQNATENYYLASGNTADWTLTAPDGSTTFYPSDPGPTINFPAPGLYTLNATGAFCLQNPMSIRVIGTPSAVNSITGTDTVCVGTPAVPYEFTAGNAEPGTIFEWQVIGGVATSPTSGNKITATFSGAGPYQVIVHRVSTQDPHCPGPDLVKTMHAPIIPIAINGKDTVCPNSVEHYTGGYSGAEAYEWSIVSSPANAGSIDDNMQPNVNITWNNYTVPTPVTLQLKITKCGRDTTKQFHVVIMPAPVLTLPATATVCSGAPLNVIMSSSPSVSSGTLTWYVDNVVAPPTVSLPSPLTRTFTFLNTNVLNTSTTHTINAIITSPNGCMANAMPNSPMVVTVLPAPVALVTPVGPLVHCGTFPADVLTATVQGGLGGPFTYTWNTTATTQSISTSAYGSYSVTVKGSNGCSSVSNIVQIVQSCGPGCTIVPAPTTSTSATQHCGVVTVGLTYSTTNYTGAPVSISLPPTGTLIPPIIQTPGNVSVSTSFTAAGSYDYTFGIPYYDVNGNLCIKVVTKSVIVPLIPELFYEIHCANGSGFNVKLLNHSNFYPGTAIDSFRFYLDGPLVQSGTADTYTSPSGLSAGTHTAKMMVYFTFNGVQDSCAVSRTITIDPLPVASFTFDRDNICVKQQKVHFTNTSTGVITSNSWLFGDGSGILLPSPDKVYQTDQANLVTLTVSNAYGCSSTAFKTVTSYPNALTGTLNPSAAVTICDGSTALLQYLPAAPTATSYTWMQEDNQVFTSTGNTFAVGTSGLYWVHVEDTVHGCWQNTNSTTVAVVAVPDPIISGDSLQCVGNTYTLFGYAGAGAGITYQWTRNGSPFSTLPNITDSQPVGTYDYQLTITVTQGSMVCSKTSAKFRVKVNAPPAAPVISFNIPGCDPYKVELTANPILPGNYNWSNGDYGNPIVASIGGPYKVWYTDNSGCTVSSAAIDVPKDPKGYLWIFPTGCYTKCPPITIPGPIIPFSQWAWYNVGPPQTVISSGTGSVMAPLNLYSSGLYGMYLYNGYCKANIDTLSLTVPRDCKTDKCDKLKLSLYTEGNCNAFMYLTLDNGYGISLPYTIGVNVGTITTSGGTVSPGVNYVYPGWTPPAGFTSGTLIFYITITLPNGRTCTSTIQTFVRGCKPSHRGSLGEENNGNNSNSNLTVAPNPAQESTLIAYRFTTPGNEAGDRSIEVYDVTGRKLASHKVDEQASGSWTLKLDAFAPGLYQVVLKQGGTVVETTRLSVTR